MQTSAEIVAGGERLASTNMGRRDSRFRPRLCATGSVEVSSRPWDAASLAGVHPGVAPAFGPIPHPGDEETRRPRPYVDPSEAARERDGLLAADLLTLRKEITS